jgi:hypothetical protein
MKFTPAEERACEDAAVWFVGELAKLGRESLRNAAFHAATKTAIAGLDRHLKQRLLLSFGAGGERFKKAAELTNKRINEMLPNNRLAMAAVDELPEGKPGEATLKNYLAIVEALLQVARGDEGSLRSLDGSELDKGTQFARRLWAVMKNSRVFDFRPEDWILANRAADVYTTEKIAKLDWTPEGAPPPPQEEQGIFRERINEAGARVPFPDPLPFEAVYIGLGHGVPLDPVMALARAGLPHRTVVGAALLGYVIWGTDGGWVAEVIQIIEPEDNFMLPSVVCMNGVWHEPMLSLAPWIITHLVGVINDHRQLIVETKPTANQRHTWQKKGKQLKVPTLIPKPYYIVRLRKEIIEETGKRTRDNLSRISRELSYRHDRRGHERCYIRRGKLPLEQKDLKKLTDAGYKVWTIDEPDSNAYRQLMERRQPPKSPEEWVAILTRWIDPMVVGPEDKPYIPAIRMRAPAQE